MSERSSKMRYSKDSRYDQIMGDHASDKKMKQNYLDNLKRNKNKPKKESSLGMFDKLLMKFGCGPKEDDGPDSGELPF